MAPSSTVTKPSSPDVIEVVSLPKLPKKKKLKKVPAKPKKKVVKRGDAKPKFTNIPISSLGLPIDKESIL